MPSVFLSPSTQEFNPYIDGGNEEYYMNIITDALIPYLEASGIEYERNDPSKTFANSVRLSNQGNFDLHLALHSNAAPPANAGQARGSRNPPRPHRAGAGCAAARRSASGDSLRPQRPVPAPVPAARCRALCSAQCADTPAP